jgi:hypothetical protein
VKTMQCDSCFVSTRRRNFKIKNRAHTTHIKVKMLLLTTPSTHKSTCKIVVALQMSPKKLVETTHMRA